MWANLEPYWFQESLKLNRYLFHLNITIKFMVVLCVPESQISKEAEKKIPKDLCFNIVIHVSISFCVR